ncbi:hypothetical protein [Pelagibius sp.]|uniref:hypothetical protein n=1 Tax=Pelagibius sp. TaxID=1931238 RepID=UPI003BB1B56E
MKKILLALPLVAFLGACGYTEKAREYVFGEGAYYGMITSCSLSEGERVKNLLELNQRAEEEGRVERAKALDCNGDGDSDF